MSESDRPEPRPPYGTRHALLWTGAAVVLPGIAHLKAGARRTGWTLLAGYTLLLGGLTGAVVNVLGGARDLVRLALQPEWLTAGAVAVTTAAVLWIAVLVHSYLLLRPVGVSAARRTAAVALVGALCLAIAAPAAATVHTAYVVHDRLNTIFSDQTPAPQVSAEEAEADPTAVWGGEDRVSILLIGSDGADDRYGVRTDSLMVANVDVEYGDVVLIGLPRNLQRVPFPEGTRLAEMFPDPYGFNELLSDVYQFVADDPDEYAIDPRADDPAADTLRRTVAHALGIDVDYYALLDLRGFRDVIDAIGGVRVRIEEPIPWGYRGDVLEPGLRTLSGRESLWYVRSRIGSDDYERMGRQGCLVKAVAEQADPWTVVTSFHQVAAAAEHTLRTNVPLHQVDPFIDLADLATSQGSMEALQLSPPQVTTANPDWDEVREIVAEAVQDQEDAQAASEAPGDGAASESLDDSEAAPEEEAESDDPEQRDSAEDPEPSPSPTAAGRQVGEEPMSLDELCP